MKYLMLIVLLWTAAAQAGLQWEQEELNVQVHPTQVSVDAVFPFSNIGKDPISFDEIRVSCGCLSPKISRRIYAPGESGSLTITFDLRNRTGKQRKATLVTTDDGSATRLYVDADIPEAFTLDPQLLQWKKGSDVETKTARLINPGTMPIKLLSATSSNPALPVVLNIVREGFEYEAVVTRRAADSNSRSVIRIVAEPPPGQTDSKMLKLYVHVQ